MAATMSTHFSRDEVLEHDIYNPAPTVSSESFEDRANNALSLLFQDSRENEDRKRLFVDAGVQHLQTLYSLLPMPCTETPNKRAEAILMEPIYPASVLQSESRSWLQAMRRRLAAKKSIRSPYYVEICRDFPYEIFSVIAKIVGRLDGFVEPFCFHGNNNKAEIISFTSVRLVNELFVLLSKFTSETVASYFKRNLSGSRKGHSAAVIVSDAKDFVFTYKKRPGKLVIGFNYGEWNVNGFPQHTF
jgi:hypothetical protein